MNSRAEIGKPCQMALDNLKYVEWKPLLPTHDDMSVYNYVIINSQRNN